MVLHHIPTSCDVGDIFLICTNDRIHCIRSDPYRLTHCCRTRNTNYHLNIRLLLEWTLNRYESIFYVDCQLKIKETIFMKTICLLEFRRKWLIKVKKNNYVTTYVPKFEIIKMLKWSYKKINIKESDRMGPIRTYKHYSCSQE